jgi:hypothetical protein
MNRYQAYRTRYLYWDGGLSPHEVRKREIVLLRDGRLDTGVQVRHPSVIPEKGRRDLTQWFIENKAQRRVDEEAARPASNASSCTLWPTSTSEPRKKDMLDPREFEMHGALQGEGEPVPGTLEMGSLDIADEIVDPWQGHPNEEMVDPNEFPERFDTPPEDDGFETVDLNKPLPPPPRLPTPMPGRPFDSRFPERNLPRNKYYPRAF